jgi:chromosome partitioning protein
MIVPTGLQPPALDGHRAVVADRVDGRQMTVVSFFNHKGGVGKTTITFNTALALAELGNSVVLIDGDAQANLTGLALSEDDYDDALDDDLTIWHSVAPLVTGAGDLVAPDGVEIRDTVWILPGDIRLSNFEGILPVGWTEALAGEARGFRVSSAMHRLFQSLSDSHQADYVLVDLGPNVGALNRSALIASDGFVVPLAPDLFSLMALPSVGNSIRDWSRQWAMALMNQPDGLDFELPAGRPQPLGYVSQQFSVYGKRPATAFRTWLGKIDEAYEAGVLAPLDIAARDETAALGSLKNFGSLIPLAQKANKALFELDGNEARGAHFTKAQATRKMFASIAEAIVEGLAV